MCHKNTTETRGERRPAPRLGGSGCARPPRLCRNGHAPPLEPPRYVGRRPKAGAGSHFPKHVGHLPRPIAIMIERQRRRGTNAVAAAIIRRDLQNSAGKSVQLAARRVPRLVSSVTAILCRPLFECAQVFTVASPADGKVGTCLIMKRAEFKAQRGNPRHHCLEAFAERDELGIRRISDFHVIDRRQRRWQSGIGKRGRAAAATTRADDFARKFITLLLLTVTPDATCAGERSSRALTNVSCVMVGLSGWRFCKSLVGSSILSPGTIEKSRKLRCHGHFRGIRLGRIRRI